MGAADPSRATPSCFAAGFADALLDPGRDLPDGVAGPRGKGAAKRFAVYRNNVTVSLIEALAAIYPTTRRLTGEDFFRALARAHVRTRPPSSPLLLDYGRELPEFIAAYPYAESVPWLADVARIERAWLDSYHAADAEPLHATALGAVPAERLGEVVLKPHPAARVVRSSFPACSIFAMGRSSDAITPLAATGAEDTLITRPDAEVIVRHLPPGGAVFLARLIDGHTLGAAASAALDLSSHFDLSAGIAGMVAAGVFTTIASGGPKW